MQVKAQDDPQNLFHHVAGRIAGVSCGFVARGRCWRDERD
jgi:hypothetical protein